MSFLSRLFTDTEIQIRDSKARCTKGKRTQRVLNEISAIASISGLASGEIWIDKIGQVTFSRHVPEQLQQSFRNVIGDD